MPCGPGLRGAALGTQEVSKTIHRALEFSKEAKVGLGLGSVLESGRFRLI